MSDRPDPKMIADAAGWLARLRSDVRDVTLETQLDEWLSRSNAHREAFTTVTRAWDLAGGVARRPVAEPADRVASGRWRWRLPAAAAAGIVALIGGGIWYSQSQPTLATGIGERRVLTLADGSTITLNTNTRLRVHFSDARRIVILDNGEVSFNVAKDAARPFVVKAGATQVTAIGTTFDVRWLQKAVAVTLVHGRVRVVETGDSGMPIQAVYLSPGQRFEDGAGRRAGVAAVNLHTVRAWTGGLLVLDATPLTDAVIEMNRYSQRRIRIDGHGAERVAISGAFKTDDPGAFARGLADLYGFQVSEDPEGYVIAPAKPGDEKSESDR